MTGSRIFERTHQSGHNPRKEITMGDEKFLDGIAIEPNPFQAEQPESVELFNLDGTVDQLP